MNARESIEKTGTKEEFLEDMKNCGFHQEPTTAQKMAYARMKIDDALQSILAESGLDLYLFDCLITSVQNDIRKAALDLHFMNGMSIAKDDAEHFFKNADVIGGNDAQAK